MIVDKSKLAAGAVGIGFRCPTVALYNGTGAPGTHTAGRRLARGVSVSLDVKTADDNAFYADDVAMESDAEQFESGTVNLEVDGLLQESERFINGLPEEETVKIGEESIPLTRTGQTAVAPHVGFGFIRVYMSNKVKLYVPVILPKVKFQQPGLDAETRKNTANFQTQKLTAAIMRTDDESADWRWMGAYYSTAEEALAVLDKLLAVVG